MYRICFVCHGNICRSPAAEMIAKQEIEARGLQKDVEVFSRAISHEEIGNDIYAPMKAAMALEGVPIEKHYASFLSEQDVRGSDVIFYMDESNRIRLVRFYGERPRLFRPITEYDPEIEEIEDPWYTGRFDVVLHQLKRCIHHIFDNLEF